MKKEKSYLVYDSEEDLGKPGSLKEHFNANEQQQEEIVQKKEDSERVAPVQENKLKKKKTIEKFLSGLIMVVLALMLATIVLIFDNQSENPNPIDNSENTTGRVVAASERNPTARQVFTYIAQNNRVIASYLNDIRALVVEDGVGFNEKLEAFKQDAIVDIGAISSFRRIYATHHAEPVLDIQTERILNIFTMIKAIEESVAREQVIATTNKHINIEIELNARSLSLLISWIERNQLEYAKINGVITLK